MNRIAPILALWVAVLAGCVTPTPKQPQILVGSVGHRVHLSLWNGADMPVAISVSIDGKVVHESVLAVATYAPPLDQVDGGGFTLGVGTHSALVEDRTRNIRKQLEFTVEQDADIEILLNRDGITLSVYGSPRAIF